MARWCGCLSRRGGEGAPLHIIMYNEASIIFCWIDFGSGRVKGGAAAFHVLCVVFGPRRVESDAMASSHSLAAVTHSLTPPLTLPSHTVLPPYTLYSWSSLITIISPHFPPLLFYPTVNSTFLLLFPFNIFLSPISLSNWWHPINNFSIYFLAYYCFNSDWEGNQQIISEFWLYYCFL